MFCLRTIDKYLFVYILYQMAILKWYDETKSFFDQVLERDTHLLSDYTDVLFPKQVN